MSTSAPDVPTHAAATETAASKTTLGTRGVWRFGMPGLPVSDGRGGIAYFLEVDKPWRRQPQRGATDTIGDRVYDLTIGVLNRCASAVLRRRAFRF